MNDNTNKSDKLYYSMGEVAEMFDVNQSLIRFWEQKFDILKPRKNKKGNRMFTPQDVENLRLIYHLVKEKGMTLTGAAKYMRDNRGVLKRDMEIIERLNGIRSVLMEIREELRPVNESDIIISAEEPEKAATLAVTSEGSRNNAPQAVVAPVPAGVAQAAMPDGNGNKVVYPQNPQQVTLAADNVSRMFSQARDEQDTWTQHGSEETKPQVPFTIQELGFECEPADHDKHVQAFIDETASGDDPLTGAPASDFSLPHPNPATGQQRPQPYPAGKGPAYAGEQPPTQRSAGNGIENIPAVAYGNRTGATESGMLPDREGSLPVDSVHPSDDEQADLFHRAGIHAPFVPQPEQPQEPEHPGIIEQTLF